MSMKEIKKELCCGCQGCAQICPGNCIEMIRDEEGFWYPQVDIQNCVDCGLCEKVCPVLQTKLDVQAVRPQAWAAMNREENERMHSSSGGVFSLLAKRVLKKDGIIYGAAWSQDYYTVRHIPVDSIEALAKLQGSKYVQSEIGDCYAQAKQNLENDRYVLFSGTPCQIEGLRCYLGKDYEKLLCVDIICHGVPSPGVWETYLRECEKKAGAAAAGVNMRSKEAGWKTFSAKIDFRNGAQQLRPLWEDPYLRAFLKNACLRPSCHNCSFKKWNRVSDLTLADFWGVENVCEEMDDDRGTSLVLTHTQKGRDALEEIHGKLQIKQVDAAEAMQYNSAGLVSVTMHEKREEFLRCAYSEGVSIAARKYLRDKRTPRSVLTAVLKKLGILPVIKKILHRS